MLNLRKTIPAAVIILAVVLGFNPLLKTGLEAAGRAAFGAKTEIGWFSLNLFTGNLKIDRLQVANKNAPMTNLFEVSQIRFGLNTEQLFYKRVNIPALTVDNILLGTPRKKSGALPAKKPAPPKPPFDLAKMARDLEMNTEALQDAFRIASPQSPAEAERIQKENQRILSEAQKMAASFDINKELAALNLNELNSVTISSADDLAKFRALLEEKQIKLKTIAATVEASSAAGNKALQDVQKNLNHLAQVRNADIDRLMDSLTFANYDLAEIGRELLGPKINGWLNTGLEYWALAQKYMPPKKEGAPPKRERFAGTTVVFPSSKTTPRFWLERLGLSGRSGLGTSNELAYHGYISDISSEQYITGRPLIVDIKGAYAQRANSLLEIKGVFDRRDTAKDSFTFVLSGFDLAGQNFWDTQTVPLEITDGLGRFDMDIKVTDGDLAGKISFTGRDLHYARLPSAGLQKLVAEAISGTKELRFDVFLSGKFTAPNIRLSTNLDALIKARLEKEIGEQIEQAKAQLIAEYDRIVGGAQDAANNALHEQQEALRQTLDARQAALNAETSRLDAAKQEIEKQVQSQADAVIKQAEDALRNVLPGGIKF